MSTLPYASLRSTTPPLYYRRPEGVTPSYYTVPSKEVQGLQVPPYTGGATATGMSAPLRDPSRSSAVLHPSVERGSVLTTPAASGATLPPPPPSPRLSHYAMPSVVNPYSQAMQKQPSTAYMAEPANPSAYLQQANAMGRWSYQRPPAQQQYPMADPVASRTAAIDAEEAAMAAEETSLRAKLFELQMVRKRQEEEQLSLSHGWAQMLEKEERYYTEPIVDLRGEIAAREQQCAQLRDHLQQAEAEAQHGQVQLQSTEHILRAAENFELERKRVQDGFLDVERRRRECVTRAERYFDVETKRVVEGNRVIRQLDGQLREMTRQGPLATLQERNGRLTGRRSTSRAVTFAPDKSIVLDLGQEDSAEPERVEDETGGMTDSYSSVQDKTRHDNAQTAPAYLGLTEDDIGGTSVAYSLNDAKDSLSLLKRRKVEMAVA